MSAKVKRIRTRDELNTLVQDGRPVVVDFWAPWCGPCKAFAPILEDAAEALSDQAIVAKINIDEAPDLARDYRVSSIPTLVYFANGAVQYESKGIQQQSEVIGRAESFLVKAAS